MPCLQQRRHILNDRALYLTQFDPDEMYSTRAEPGLSKTSPRCRPLFDVDVWWLVGIGRIEKEAV